MMKIAGIVAEYNPMHTGHLWQIEETRRLGATHLVAVMSGCFTQRGEPALWDKWTRAEAALAGGADLVIELPLPWAAATAQRFAMGAVSLLAGLGVVDMLSFGSECGEIELLRRAVTALSDPEALGLVPRLMTGGVTYAAARQQAVEALHGTEAARLLTSPNNILGIEYMLWLDRLGSKITPVTVRRKGAGHDSNGLGEYASASALRQLLHRGETRRAAAYLPEAARELFIAGWERGECYSPAMAERPMLAKLRTLSREDIARLPDISEGLENRIYDAVRSFGSVGRILEAAKTKRYSHARLRRILLSGWLGVEGDLCREMPPYIRLLAMNSRGREVLAAAGEKATLPISQSAARIQKMGEREQRLIKLEAAADDLYATVTAKVQPCGRDYTKSIIIR